MTKCLLCPKLKFLFQFCLTSPETHFAQQAIAYFFIAFHRNFWVAGKVTSDPFSSLPERKERKGH